MEELLTSSCSDDYDTYGTRNTPSHTLETPVKRKRNDELNKRQTSLKGFKEALVNLFRFGNFYSHRELRPIHEDPDFPQCPSSLSPTV